MRALESAIAASPAERTGTGQRWRRPRRPIAWAGAQLAVRRSRPSSAVRDRADQGAGAPRLAVVVRTRRRADGEARRQGPRDRRPRRPPRDGRSAPRRATCGAPRPNARGRVALARLPGRTPAARREPARGRTARARRGRPAAHLPTRGRRRACRPARRRRAARARRSRLRRSLSRVPTSGSGRARPFPAAPRARRAPVRAASGRRAPHEANDGRWPGRVREWGTCPRP